MLTSVLSFDSHSPALKYKVWPFFTHKAIEIQSRLSNSFKITQVLNVRART